MPTVLVVDGFRFFFYINENNETAKESFGLRKKESAD